jgi:hypothetical protein
MENGRRRTLSTQNDTVEDEDASCWALCAGCDRVRRADPVEQAEGPVLVLSQHNYWSASRGGGTMRPCRGSGRPGKVAMETVQASSALL